VSILFGGALLAVALSGSAAAEDFYRGKTVNLLIGHEAGGEYDTDARLVARHIGNHIPGNPTVVPQNMSGASGMRVTNFVYNSAPRDGTTIGMPPRNYPIAPFANERLHYDGRGLIPLGSISTEVQVGAVWHAVGVTKFDDLMKREITAGVTSYYDDIGSLSLVTKAITGAKLKLVSGYPGGNDIQSAMEKGELDSEFGWSWGAIKATKKNWLDQKKLNIVLQIGTAKSPELPNVPSLIDYAKNPLDRNALELLLAPDAFAWPFVAPPGVPADRIALLRHAFDETMKDPNFVSDAKHLYLEPNPMSGAAMQDRIEHILGFDASVISRAKELVKPPS